ncbi:aldehyde dehydrogenase family protein [Erythrobacter sp. GH3-10]|uniref:Aldehyde dehydrogenase family protein n=1 Tax=Aurantiacibacter rhizosphaerae TaxID=2691582 RepID=A0A844XCP9_9SPHN|nr:aldehyde dehydrogenase family protein [Aurantiacibacter rhizosphaerae]
MPDATRHFIDGEWIQAERTAPVINPATTQEVARVAMGSAADAKRAIDAAARAFPAWSQTSVDERLAIIGRINQALKDRSDEIGDAIMAEMGAPFSLARGAQAGSGPQHFDEILRLLPDFAFEEPLGSTMLRREPIGVCTLITPWNWPMNQIAAKVAPALAAGCTMVLKPSELAPLDATILAEIVEEAGLPAGVFNLVHGTGGDLGDTLTGHPKVDMVSFTGSTRAGIAIGQNAARSIKRVALELGGKSAVIVLEDADLEKAVSNAVASCMFNSGQSCNAGTRLLVPAARQKEAQEIAGRVARNLTVGMPQDDADLGPVANEAQYGRVITHIEQAIVDGATLVAGGSEKPDGLTGYFVAPTVLGDVTTDMRVATDEVFGPVLAIMGYDDIDQAVEIANDSEYGLSGYVWGSDIDAAAKVAARMRTGMVHLNGSVLDSKAPFGGYRKSGNGREWGVHGLLEFLEVKSVYGGAKGKA